MNNKGFIRCKRKAAIITDGHYANWLCFKFKCKTKRTINSI